MFYITDEKAKIVELVSKSSKPVKVDQRSQVSWFTKNNER